MEFVKYEDFAFKRKRISKRESWRRTQPSRENFRENLAEIQMVTSLGRVLKRSVAFGSLRVSVGEEGGCPMTFNWISVAQWFNTKTVHTPNLHFSEEILQQKD